MKKTALLLAAAALVGCNEKEMEQLKLQATQAQDQARKAQADATQLKSEKDALAAELPKAKQEAEAAKTAKAAAEDALAKAKPEKESLAAEASRWKQELETVKADLLSAKTAKSEAEKARDVLQKEKDAAVAEAAKSKSGSATTAKEIEDLKGMAKALSDRLAAKEMEAAQAGRSLAAAEKRAQEAQAKADKAAAALRERLTCAGKNTLAPNLSLPVTFTARKGETIRWAWTLDETPPDLAVDALEFVVTGPDGAKACGVRAGVEKKADTGCVEASADGRWTVFWMNRHPSAPFTIGFTVTLDTTTAAPKKSGG
jgi:hypothetical protein